MNWNKLELPDNPYYQDDAVIIYNADCRDSKCSFDKRGNFHSCREKDRDCIGCKHEKIIARSVVMLCHWCGNRLYLSHELEGDDWACWCCGYSRSVFKLAPLRRVANNYGHRTFKHGIYAKHGNMLPYD